jgi:hypothetical protein
MDQDSFTMLLRWVGVDADSREADTLRPLISRDRVIGLLHGPWRFINSAPARITTRSKSRPPRTAKHRRNRVDHADVLVVVGRFLRELYARGQAELGVDVGEVGLHGAG